MKGHAIFAFHTLVGLLTLSLPACSGSTIEDAETGGDQEVVSAGAVDRAAYAASYEDRGQSSQDLGDLDLGVDGRYTAHVLTTVTGARMACRWKPCNTLETGSWSVTHAQDGIDRLRLKPDQGPLRIYRATRLADSGALFLERKDSSQALQVVAIPFTGSKCSVTLCVAGTHCEEKAGIVSCVK